MARLRFPGRPGYRFDRIGVRYGADEASQTTDHTLSIVSSIHRGLRRFKEVFGDSDEEDEFQGFTAKEISMAEACVRRLAKAEQLLRQKQEEELKECYERSHARLADLEASGLPISRLPANFRDTYGCVVRSGLVEVKSTLKGHHTRHAGQAEDMGGVAGYQVKVATMNRIKLKRLTHTIETPGVPRKPVGRRKKIVPAVNGAEGAPNTSWLLPNSTETQHAPTQSSSFSSKYKTLTQQLLAKATKRAATNKDKKKFVMPTKSSRSSRVIKPTKRFLEEDNDVSTPALGKQPKLAPSWPSLIPGETPSTTLSMFGLDATGDNKINAFSSFQGQGISLSPFSANREKGFPAFSSAPQPCGTSSFSDIYNGQEKPVGLLDQPLIVEGKRAKKPSLIMRMKLVEDNPEDEIKLQQQILDITSPTKGSLPHDASDVAALAQASSLSGKSSSSCQLGTTKSLIAPAKLFTDSAHTEMYHSLSKKKKNRRPGLALPQNNTVVLRQAKLQLNRTALNRSKAALARSLKAQLKREAKQERRKKLSEHGHVHSSGDVPTLFGQPGSSLSQLSPFSQLHASGIDKQKSGLFEGMEDGVGSFSPGGYGQSVSLASPIKEEEEDGGVSELLHLATASSSSSASKGNGLKSKKSRELKLAEAQCRASLKLFEERCQKTYPVGYIGPCLVCQLTTQVKKNRSLPTVPLCKPCKRFYGNHLVQSKVFRPSTHSNCSYYGRCVIHHEIDKVKICKSCRLQKLGRAVCLPSRWKGESAILTRGSLPESLTSISLPGSANIKDPTKKKRHKMKMERRGSADQGDSSPIKKRQGETTLDPNTTAATPKRTKHKSGDRSATPRVGEWKSPSKAWLDGCPPKGLETPLSVDVEISGCDEQDDYVDDVLSPSSAPVKQPSSKRRQKLKVKQENKSEGCVSVLSPPRDSLTKKYEEGGDRSADSTTPRRLKHRSGEKSGTPKHSKNYETPLSVDVGIAGFDFNMSPSRGSDDMKSPSRRNSMSSPSKRPLTNGDAASSQPTELTVTERVSSRGPRIKHVCRRAAMVFPQQRATFGDVAEASGQRTLTLSALPNKEKEEILARTKLDQKKVVSSDEDDSAEDTSRANKTMTAATATATATTIAAATTTQSSDLPQPQTLEQPQDTGIKGEKGGDEAMNDPEDPFLEDREKAVAMAMKMLAEDGTEDSPEKKEEKEEEEVGDNGQRKTSPKKTLRKERVLGEKAKLKKMRPPGQLRKIRCGQCQGCHTQDCGVCGNCLDKPKFGGFNKLKKACIKTVCSSPHYSRKATQAFIRHKSPSEMERDICRNSKKATRAFIRPKGTRKIKRNMCYDYKDENDHGGSDDDFKDNDKSKDYKAPSSFNQNGSSSGRVKKRGSQGDGSGRDNRRVGKDGDLVDSHEGEMEEGEGGSLPDDVIPSSPRNGLDMDGSVGLIVKGQHKKPSSANRDGGGGGSGRKRYPSKMLEATVNVALADVRVPPNLGKMLSHDSYVGDKAWKKDKLLQLHKTTTASELLPIQSKTAYSSEVTLKAHLIRADYRPDYEVDTAWTHGFSLILTGPSCIRTLCYLCGAGGKEELIFCIVCCQPFHDFCLEDYERPDVAADNVAATVEDEGDDHHHVRSGSIYWCCRRCQFCNVCGQQNGLLKCHRCRDMYHPECLGPNYPTKPSRKKNIWVCTKCVRCKSCGATTPGVGTNATWTYDFSLCYKCGKLMDKGNFCPVCHKCYSDDDWDSKMIHCSVCESWVHAKCEELTDEMYQLLSCLPEEVTFTCRVCSPTQPRYWETVLQSEFLKGLLNVVNTLMGSKCTQTLMESGPPREVKKSVGRVGVKPTGETSSRNIADGKLVPSSAINTQSPLTSPNFSVCGSTTETCSSIGDGAESVDSFGSFPPYQQKETQSKGSFQACFSDWVTTSNPGDEGGISVSCSGVSSVDGNDIPSMVVDLGCGDGEEEMEDSEKQVMSAEKEGAEIVSSSEEGSKNKGETVGCVGDSIDCGRDQKEDGKYVGCVSKQSGRESLGSAEGEKEEQCVERGEKHKLGEFTGSFQGQMETSGCVQQEEQEGGSTGREGQQREGDFPAGFQRQSELESNKSVGGGGDIGSLDGPNNEMSLRVGVLMGDGDSQVSKSDIVQMGRVSEIDETNSIQAVKEHSKNVVALDSPHSSIEVPQLEQKQKQCHADSVIPCKVSSSSCILNSSSLSSSLTHLPLDTVKTSEGYQPSSFSNLHRDPSSIGLSPPKSEYNDRNILCDTIANNKLHSKDGENPGTEINPDSDHPASSSKKVDVSSDVMIGDGAKGETASRCELTCPSSEDKNGSSIEYSANYGMDNPNPYLTCYSKEASRASVSKHLFREPDAKNVECDKPGNDESIEPCTSSSPFPSSHQENTSQSAPDDNTSKATRTISPKSKTSPGCTAQTASILKQCLQNKMSPSSSMLPSSSSSSPLSSSSLTSASTLLKDLQRQWRNAQPSMLLPSPPILSETNQEAALVPVGNQTPKKGTQCLIASVSPGSGNVMEGDDNFNPKNFHAVKLKVQGGSYDCLEQFNEDMVRIIQWTLSQNESFVTRRKQAHSVRSIFIKLMERSFPWFNVNTCKLWEHNRNLPAGMLKEAVLPPYADHTYAQWLERREIPMNPQPSPFKHVFGSPQGSDEFSPQKISHQLEKPLGVGGIITSDTRCCRLCGVYGDQMPQDCGRLLYCGLDDWVHINCALWSAEVFEEDDGSLQNVQDCISRGRKLRCNLCHLLGATVGCCASNCSANFHFMCARDAGNLFQEDKRMYCSQHADWVTSELVEGDGFETQRRVCVDIDKTRNKGWGKAADPALINVVFGSCTVESLGVLKPSLSDTQETLLPINFCCTRIYWSTRDARCRCVYTCRIVEIKPDAEVSEVRIQDMRIVHDEAHPDFVPLDQLDLTGINTASIPGLHPTTPNTSCDIDSMNPRSRCLNRSRSNPETPTLPKPMNLTGLSSSTLELLNIKHPEKYIPPAKKSLSAVSSTSFKTNSDDLGLLHIANRLNTAASGKILPLPAPVSIKNKTSFQLYNKISYGQMPLTLRNCRSSSASPVMFGQGASVIQRRASSEETNSSSSEVHRLSTLVRARSESPYTRQVDTNMKTPHFRSIRRAGSVSPQPTARDGWGGCHGNSQQQDVRAMATDIGIPQPILEVPENVDGDDDDVCIIEDDEEIPEEDSCSKRLDKDVTPGNGSLVDNFVDGNCGSGLSSHEAESFEGENGIKAKNVSDKDFEMASNTKKSDEEEDSVEEKEGKSGEEEEGKEESGDVEEENCEKSETGSGLIGDEGRSDACNTEGETNHDDKSGDVEDVCKKGEENDVSGGDSGDYVGRREGKRGDEEEDKDGKKKEMFEKDIGNFEEMVAEEDDDDELEEGGGEEAAVLQEEKVKGLTDGVDGEKSKVSERQNVTENALEVKEGKQTKSDGEEMKSDFMSELKGKSEMLVGTSCAVSGADTKAMCSSHSELPSEPIVIDCDSDSDQEGGKKIATESTNDLLRDGTSLTAGGRNCSEDIPDDGDCGREKSVTCFKDGDGGCSDNGGDVNVTRLKWSADTTDTESDIFVIDDLSVEDSVNENEDEQFRKNEVRKGLVNKQNQVSDESGVEKDRPGGNYENSQSLESQACHSKDLNCSENVDKSLDGDGSSERKLSVESVSVELASKAKTEKENNSSSSSGSGCESVEGRQSRSGRCSKTLGVVPVKEYPLRRRSSNIKKQESGEEEKEEGSCLEGDEDEDVVIVDDDDTTMKKVAGGIKSDEEGKGDVEEETEVKTEEENVGGDSKKDEVKSVEDERVKPEVKSVEDVDCKDLKEEDQGCLSGSPKEEGEVKCEMECKEEENDGRDKRNKGEEKDTVRLVGGGDDLGAYKCERCGLEYRTKESCLSHSRDCRLEVASTSDEEEVVPTRRETRSRTSRGSLQGQEEVLGRKFDDKSVPSNKKLIAAYDQNRGQNFSSTPAVNVHEPLSIIITDDFKDGGKFSPITSSSLREFSEDDASGSLNSQDSKRSLRRSTLTQRNAAPAHLAKTRHRGDMGSRSTLSPDGSTCSSITSHKDGSTGSFCGRSVVEEKTSPKETMLEAVGLVSRRSLDNPISPNSDIEGVSPIKLQPRMSMTTMGVNTRRDKKSPGMATGGARKLSIMSGGMMNKKKDGGGEMVAGARTVKISCPTPLEEVTLVDTSKVKRKRQKRIWWVEEEEEDEDEDEEEGGSGKEEDREEVGDASVESVSVARRTRQRLSLDSNQNQTRKSSEVVVGQDKKKKSEKCGDERDRTKTEGGDGEERKQAQPSPQLRSSRRSSGRKTEPVGKEEDKKEFEEGCGSKKKRTSLVEGKSITRQTRSSKREGECEEGVAMEVEETERDDTGDAKEVSEKHKDEGKLDVKVNLNPDDDVEKGAVDEVDTAAVSRKDEKEGETDDQEVVSPLRRSRRSSGKSAKMSEYIALLKGEGEEMEEFEGNKGKEEQFTKVKEHNKDEDVLGKATKRGRGRPRIYPLSGGKDEDGEKEKDRGTSTGEEERMEGMESGDGLKSKTEAARKFDDVVAIDQGLKESATHEKREDGLEKETVRSEEIVEDKTKKTTGDDDVKSDLESDSGSKKQMDKDVESGGGDVIDLTGDDEDDVNNRSKDSDATVKLQEKPKELTVVDTANLQSVLPKHVAEVMKCSSQKLRIIVRSPNVEAAQKIGELLRQTAFDVNPAQKEVSVTTDFTGGKKTKQNNTADGNDDIEDDENRKKLVEGEAKFASDGGVESNTFKSSGKSGEICEEPSIKPAEESSTTTLAQSRSASASPDSLSAAYDIQSDDFSSETSNDGYDESSSSVAKTGNGGKERDDDAGSGENNASSNVHRNNNDGANDKKDDDDDDVILVEAHGLQSPEPVNSSSSSTNVGASSIQQHSSSTSLSASSGISMFQPNPVLGMYKTATSSLCGNSPLTRTTFSTLSPMNSPMTARSGPTSAFSPCPQQQQQRPLSNASSSSTSVLPNVQVSQQQQQPIIVADMATGRYFIQPSNPALTSPPVNQQQQQQQSATNLLLSSPAGSNQQSNQTASTLLQNLSSSQAQQGMIFPQMQQQASSLHLQQPAPPQATPSLVLQQHASPPRIVIQNTSTQPALSPACAFPATDQTSFPAQTALPVPIPTIQGGVTPGSLIQTHNPLSGALPFVSLTGTPGLSLNPQLNLQPTLNPTPMLQTGVALNAAGQPVMLTSQALITPTGAQPTVYLPGMVAQPQHQLSTLLPPLSQPPQVLHPVPLTSLSQANLIGLSHSSGIKTTFNPSPPKPANESQKQAMATTTTTFDQWNKGSRIIPTSQQGSWSLSNPSPNASIACRQPLFSSPGSSTTAMTMATSVPMTSSTTCLGQLQQQSQVLSPANQHSSSATKQTPHLGDNSQTNHVPNSSMPLQARASSSTVAPTISNTLTASEVAAISNKTSGMRPKHINYMGSFELNSSNLQSLFKATAPSQPETSSSMPGTTSISEMERNRSRNIMELVKTALANRDKVVPGVEVRPVITDTPYGPKKVLRVFIDEDYINKPTNSPNTTNNSNSIVNSSEMPNQFTSLINSFSNNNSSRNNSNNTNQRLKGGCNAIQEGLQMRRPLKLVHSSQAQKRKQATMSAIDMATESKRRQLESASQPVQNTSTHLPRRIQNEREADQGGRVKDFLSVLESNASRYPPYTPISARTSLPSSSSQFHDQIPSFLKDSAIDSRTATQSQQQQISGSSLSHSEHQYHQSHGQHFSQHRHLHQRQHQTLSEHPRLQPSAGTVGQGSPHKRASFPQGQKVRRKKKLTMEGDDGLVPEDGRKRKKTMARDLHRTHQAMTTDENREIKKKKKGSQKLARMKGSAGGAHPIIHHKKAESSLPQASLEEEVVATPLNLDFNGKGVKAKEGGVQGRGNESRLRFEITSDDGFSCQGETIEEAWNQVVEKVKDVRAASRMKQLSYAGMSGQTMFGVNHDSVVYLIEQLYGAVHCHRNYRFKFHRYDRDLVDQEVPLNLSGCARTEGFTTRKPFDMFNFLKSVYRIKPGQDEREKEEEMELKSARRATSLSLPMAMRFRKLKTFAKEAVDVYRSKIHGRGLFCKRNIDAGEMVIEYAGEVIRASLTDKREKYYESKGIGCYMFRIDDDEVVDATMHGSAARFINHSCEPNCFSKVIQVDGKKHIVIFAIRPIKRGEELTYDYKFPIEEVKIPCHCESKKCRKYLN